MVSIGGVRFVCEGSFAPFCPNRFIGFVDLLSWSFVARFARFGDGSSSTRTDLRFQSNRVFIMVGVVSDDFSVHIFVR